MKSVFAGKVGTWFALSVLITGAIAIGLYAAIARSTDDRKKIERTHDIVRSLRQFNDFMNQAIISARTYTLRGDEAVLKTYAGAILSIKAEIASLRGLVQKNPAQIDRISKVEQLLQERVTMLDGAIDRKRKNVPVVPAPPSRQGDQISRQIRQIVTDMQTAEYQTSAKHSQSAAISSRRAMAVVFAGTFTSLAILATVFYLFAREIERRQLMDESLRQSEERFRGAFDAAVVGMTIFAPDGRFLQVNRSLCEILGRAEEELLATDFQSITHPDDLEADIEQLAQILDGIVHSYESEKRYLHKKGHIVWIHLSVSVVRDSKREPLHFVGVIEEITSRKETEAAMAKAKAAAEAAVETKAAFLANMSHEIRTPMNGVLGVAELLLETPLDSVQRDYAVTIRNSADALLIIINDILDLSKIDAGKMAIEQVEFNLRTIMEEVADLLAPRAHQKGLQVNCRIPPGFPERLLGDPVRLRQVLTNLLGNAVKFTEVGEVSLEAKVCSDDEKGATLQILIHDTGIGIPPEQQEAIFEGFTQVDGGPGRRYGGTGLGLTICRQLAHLMGGQVGMESEPGKGSTFWLELTLPKASVSTESSPGDTDSKSLEGLRLWIVDENGTNRRVLREHLISWGCQTQEIESIPKLLTRLAQRNSATQPTLILLDESLAKSFSDQFTDPRSRIPDLGTISLVLVRSPGRTDLETGQGSLRYETTLTKPVRRSHLLNALLDAIERRHGTSGLVREPEPSLAEPTRLNLQVLVADDHAVNRKVASRMLEQMGCIPTTVDNGQEAVELLEKNLFDVVLMDVQMPVLDGLEATRRIRLREKETGRPRIPILAITAHAMEGDKLRCLAAGMDGYVSKPVKQQEIFAALTDFSAPSDRIEVTLPEDRNGDGATKVFDFDDLLERCDGDEAMVREIVDSFLTFIPDSIEKLESAFGERNLERVAIEAHGLKGSCLTIRATSLAEVCRTIEEHGTNGKVTEATKAIGELRTEWKRLRETLENLQRVGV